MLRQLRKKLIFAYMLATGLLLSVIIIGLLALSLKQYEAGAVGSYQAAGRDVADTVRNSIQISHSWLAEREAEENLIISVYSNSVPLSFPGAWSPPTDRGKLLEKLKGYAQQKGFFAQASKIRQGELTSPVYSVYGEQGEHYYGSIYLEKTGEKTDVILILQWLADEKEHYRRTVLLYLSVNLAGLFALFFICRIFVNHTLQPLETGMKRQNEFIAAASHELRAPLTVIRAGLHAVSVDETKAGQFFSAIEKEAERMAVLVEDMLQLALADTRTWTIQEEPVHMDMVLISIHDSLAELCRKKGQPFTLKLQEAEIPAFLGDCQRIEQIILILTDNAANYSPAGSPVTVAAFSDHKHVFIEVEDHGCGIADEEKKRIFDRFYRADRSRNDKTHYGLGLSIAMELTRLHRGKLTVQDTEGGGSTFVLQFPIYNPVHK